VGTYEESCGGDAETDCEGADHVVCVVERERERERGRELRWIVDSG
jgi:hypothetical protein